MTVEKNTTDLSSISAKSETPVSDLNFFYQKLTFGLIACLFLSLAIWSWRKWPDILVDFGQQLYIPWQLANGRHLYTDLAFLHGPFSQYFNAFWFYLFGTSLTVMIYVNLCIMACMTAVIYKTIRLFADRLTATACAIVFLSVFGFAQYVGIGNYNWITPYSPEAPHGVLLTATFILFWSRFVMNHERFAGALAALCLGIALLTKIDTGIAAIAVASVGIIFAFFTQTENSKIKTTNVLLFAGIASAPALLFFLYFLTYMPAGESLKAVGSGLSIISNEILNNYFFKHVMGMDNAAVNLIRMAGMSSLLFGLIFIAAIIDIFCRRWLRNPLRLGIPLAFVIFILLLFLPNLFPWDKITRALPLLIVAVLTVFMILFFKSSERNHFRLTLLPMILWTVLALALLLKIALRVRISHYGFYLTMPAALVTVICLLYWIPHWLKTKYQSGMVFRLLVIAMLTIGIIHYISLSNHYYSVKNFPVGKGKDIFFTYQPELFEPAAVFDSSLKWMEAHMPPGATVSVLPEGVMINYLTRRPTSLSITNFMMTELTLFGEDRILDDFKAHPPDYVMLVHKDSSEFGVGSFGIDPNNGLKIMQWVNKNYKPVALIGEEPFQTSTFGTRIIIGRDPFQPGRFGIKILKRNQISQKRLIQ